MISVVFTCLLASVSAYIQFDPVRLEKSPLNAAVAVAIDTINKNGFIDAQYEKFYGPPASPVPMTCQPLGYPILDLVEADSDLARVINSGRVRIGVAFVARKEPILFQPVLANGQLGPFTGIEAEEAREVVRLIGEHYGVALTPEFIVLPNTGYQTSIIQALEDRDVDLTWTRTSVTAQRADNFDYTCVNFATGFFLASAKAFDPNNVVPGTVACLVDTIFCTLPLPAGFTQKVYQTEAEFNNAIFDLSPNPNPNPADYLIGGREELVITVANPKCKTCQVTNIQLGDATVWSPATRKLEYPQDPQGILNSIMKHAAALKKYSEKYTDAKSKLAVQNEARAAIARALQACQNTQIPDKCAEAVNLAFGV